MTPSHFQELLSEADRILSSPVPERRAVGQALLDVLGDFLANGKPLEPEPGVHLPTWHMKRPSPRCPEHGPMVETRGRWGGWQDSKWSKGQWRQLVCGHADCWAYFIQRRAERPETARRHAA